jgi:hypothetical protein
MRFGLCLLSILLFGCDTQAADINIVQFGYYCLHKNSPLAMDARIFVDGAGVAHYSYRSHMSGQNPEPYWHQYPKNSIGNPIKITGQDGLLYKLDIEGLSIGTYDLSKNIITLDPPEGYDDQDMVQYGAYQGFPTASWCRN